MMKGTIKFVTIIVVTTCYSNAITILNRKIICFYNGNKFILNILIFRVKVIYKEKSIVTTINWKSIFIAFSP